MILAIDCGSTNHKVALFDEELRRLAEDFTSVRYFVRDELRAEFQPGQIWRDTVDLIRRVCAVAQIQPRQIRTIAITSQAQTFTLVNSSGDAVIPFLSWADKRAQEESAELAAKLSERFHYHCSFPTPMAQLQVAKLGWLARHLPPSTRLGTKVMSLPTYLAWQLAGLHCTDANLAAMSGLYSLSRNDWWSESLSACSLAAEDCGEVIPVGMSVPARRACAELNLSPELQIVFAGNDQTAGAYGNGIRPGGLVLTLGTALVAYRFAGEGRGPYPSAGCWGPYPGGGFYELLTRDQGCAALDWAVDQVMPGAEPEFFKLATTAPRGEAFFFPSLMHTNEAWIGSKDTAAKTRAVMEGISFSLRELVERMPARCGAPEPIAVIGGGSANPFWLAMLANILNHPLRRGRGDNLLGAAMLSRPGAKPVPGAESGCFFPEPEQVEDYERIYRAWQREASVKGVV